MERRLVALQILRFFSAAVVVVSHLPTLATTVGAPMAAVWRTGLLIGHAGVDVFFVLSGFVIALSGPLAETRPSGAAFFWRRWRRVAPVYFVLSLPMVAGAAPVGALDPARLVATFLFWPALSDPIAKPYLFVGWTLCFEMVFYTAVALALAGGRLRRNLVILVAIVAALLAIRFATGWQGARFLTGPLFLEFGAGVALAALRGRIVRLPAAVGGVLGVLALAVFGMEAAIGACPLCAGGDADLGVGDLGRVALWGGPATLLVAAALILEPFARGRLARFLAIGGDASYSIYLAQAPWLVLTAVAWQVLHAPRDTLVLSVTGFTLSIAGGLLIWRTVEQPIVGAMKRVTWPAAQAEATS
jgi:exopolysaccharide production protein ExoZ